jgi:ppGpp synthetase/RelA/SpoT-type nucleotidyltranferase
MTNPAPHDDLLAMYDELRHSIKIHMNGIASFLGEHPELNEVGRPIVHSCKSRLKDREHLRAKIQRKIEKKCMIDRSNLFTEITDLAGVRILHIFQEGFTKIDKIIRKKIIDGDWHLAERPKAYTWDPEAVEFFEKFELDILKKDSSYTSVHYLIKPRSDSPICCEVQVRTLFEEIWGEVDHQINYPFPTDNIACAEQLKVLAKIVGAGSRLLDSLQRVHETSRL